MNNLYIYNIQQSIIYIVLSVLLTIIITNYYIKKINLHYFIVFTLLFIIFYLFFYLINLENKESFENKRYEDHLASYYKKYGNEEEEHHKPLPRSRYHEEEEEEHPRPYQRRHHYEEEEEHPRPYQRRHHYEEEEYPTQQQQQPHEEEEEHHRRPRRRHHYEEEEEEHHYPLQNYLKNFLTKLNPYQQPPPPHEEEEHPYGTVPPHEEEQLPPRPIPPPHEEEQYPPRPVPSYPQEEETNYNDFLKNFKESRETKESINSIKGNTPINININYNGENIINDNDNNKLLRTKQNNKNDNKNQNKKNDCATSRNLGDYSSRVYNNSDWIYGTQAWTDSPDYYIPHEDNYLLPLNYTNRVDTVSQKQNELTLKKKYSKKDPPCPLMINTPWSEYKSGDKEPTGFNL